ncbi:hypothetical protein IFM89_020332 [Coptis chinensis]|uniref:F-box domain-containing protein n=1 Tax=Coptis chinensis TaxID=261450 RepID=A0A835LHX6_9MAGN|nr:hypothetical protein IFM89_020332 [Coptis chinensis]
MANVDLQYSSPEMRNRVDRISDLPLHVLHHILSFLPTEHAVRTCLLSSYWRNIWRFVHTLYFDESFDDTIEEKPQFDFTKFVDSVLILRDPSHLQKLHLNLVDLSVGESRVNIWIRYSMNHNVEVIDIVNESHGYFDLTPCIFTCESLREFKLNGNSLNLSASICLPALKVMHLYEVCFENGQLGEAFFSAIPSLETLILEDCIFDDYDIELITIFACQLKTLIMNGDYPRSVEIFAPVLISLELNSDDSTPESIRFKSDIIHLKDVKVSLPASCFESIIQLFTVLKNAHSLALRGRFLLSFTHELLVAPSLLECIQASSCNLRWLKLGTEFSNAEILAINTILSHSRQVETIKLVNEVSKDECGTTTGKYFQAEKVWLKYKLPHLKSVEIQDFRGSENEMKFVKVILENAVSLEKLVITASYSGSETMTEFINRKNKMVETGKKLLTYERASSSVGILFV